MGKRKQKIGHGGSKKIGRNKVKCERYTRENRRMKNKTRKIKKHLRKHPNDFKSLKYLNEH